MNKEKAIETIKIICKKYKHLSLRISHGAASWDKKWDDMNPLDWKHIGYVGALAFAFDIDEVSL